MRAVNKEAGKVPHPNAGVLLPPAHAQQCPVMLLDVPGAQPAVKLGTLPEGARARIVLARFRGSADRMYLQRWRNCIVKAFAEEPRVDVAELHMMDLAVRL